MSPKAPVKSTYHHGDLESALVQAAITLVRKYGPDQLSLRAVSSDVGVSPSASYHYFKDKDALVSAVGTVLLDHLAAKQVKAVAKVKGSDAKAALKKFEALGYAYFQWAKSEPNLYRLIFGGFCEYEMKEHEGKAWLLLNRALDELQKTGLITKSARVGGEVLVWSSVHGASSLIIENMLPEDSYPLVIAGIKRSLGIKES